MAEVKLCSVEGCGKRVMGRGWCATHYQRWRFHGDHLYEAPQKPTQCAVDGCLRPVLQREWCRRHYMRWYKHRDPLKAAFTPAEKRTGDNHCGKANCPGAAKIRTALHYLRNKSEYLKRAKAQPIEQTRKAKRKYAVANPAKGRARVLAYKRQLKHATPPWLTSAQWAEMNAVYHEARRLTAETGVPHHVDHIVPLKGRIVSGLHVPWNLRVLTAEENQKRPRIYAGD